MGTAATQQRAAPARRSLSAGARPAAVLAAPAAAAQAERPADLRTGVQIYVLGSPLGLLKLGVAADPKRRLRNLQVGSPVPLTLAAQYPISDRPTAQAVAATLQERFRARRERGDWFRATPEEVARVLAEPGLTELYRPAEAGERAAAREAAVAARAEAAAASAGERRRRKRALRRSAADLLGGGKTQVAVAEALGISDRTIRNWKQAKSFQNDIERARERARVQWAEAWDRFVAHNPNPQLLLASRRGGRRQTRSQRKRSSPS
jgi:Meiotically Up-regulated Gene 113 (MUG113) protein/Homeodomain-like domain-containing protein